MPKTKKSRDAETYRILPPLDAETYAGLRANIALNGVQVPIVRDEKGCILDGFARAKIARELGYDCPSVTVSGLSEQEKRSQVRALNLARRQLDWQAKRKLIADGLKENPDDSVENPESDQAIIMLWVRTMSAMWRHQPAGSRLQTDSPWRRSIMLIPVSTCHRCP
jgi:ParB-like chromosome segregation protein Spo0J